MSRDLTRPPGRGPTFPEGARSWKGKPTGRRHPARHGSGLVPESELELGPSSSRDPLRDIELRPGGAYSFREGRCTRLTWPTSGIHLSGSSLGITYIRPVTHSCPSCDGKGRIEYGRSGQSIVCYLCDGAGQVTKQVLVRVERGRELSRLRVNAGVSLRELAKQARINPTVLTDVEHGRAEASAHVTAAYASLAHGERGRFLQAYDSG